MKYRLRSRIWRQRWIRFGAQRKCSVTPYHLTGLWATSVGRRAELGLPPRPAYVYIGDRRFTLPLWLLNTVFRALSTYTTTSGRLVR